MASIRVKAQGDSLDSSSEDLETSLTERKGVKRNSYHIHYPGW